MDKTDIEQVIRASTIGKRLIVSRDTSYPGVISPWELQELVEELWWLFDQK